MMVYKTGVYSFMFLLLSLSTLIFFFKIKKDDENLNDRRNIFNKIFDIIIQVLTFSVGIGWIILIFYMLIQKLFPSIKHKLEVQLQFIFKYISPITTITFLIVLSAVVIMIVFDITFSLMDLF